MTLQRLVGNRATCAELARRGLNAVRPVGSGTGREPERIGRSFKYESPSIGKIDLSPHIGAIRAKLVELYPEKFAKGSKPLDQFEKKVADSKAWNFDTWAEGKAIRVDWKQILKSAAGVDVDAVQAREKEMFGTQREDKKFVGGRMEGVSQSGFLPVHPDTRIPMLDIAKPGDYDYSENDDTRVLQLLRQVSTQFYLYLAGRNKLGEAEQEIQTMFAYGSLLVGSNNLETARNLYVELTDLKGTAQTNEVVYSILTGQHGKGILAELSQRHAAKLETFYEGVRQQRVTSPHVQTIIDHLIAGTLVQITNLGDPNQVEEFVKNKGRIYILTAPSLTGVSHAEQRLIELLNIAQLKVSDRKAWVAGKKRPCFGCWVHERLTNTKLHYQLVYQDQPGKGFMNTYRAAHSHEKDEWHAVLADPNFKVFESEKFRGDAGPESDSEAEEQLPIFDDEEVLVDGLTDGRIGDSRRAAIKRHWTEAGGDYDILETVSRARKRPKLSPEEDTVMANNEDTVEADFAKFRKVVKSSRNPAVRKRYPLGKQYRRRSVSKSSL